MSMPHYPQLNGHAESAVKAIKHLIKKVAPSGNLDSESFNRVPSTLGTPQTTLVTLWLRFYIATLSVPASQLTPKPSRTGGMPEPRVVTVMLLLVCGTPQHGMTPTPSLLHLYR